MSTIEVKKVVKAIQTSDGAGVKLKRSMGVPELDFIDPFLMFDEFGSENKDDYIAGFPAHPHRGIETVTYMLAGRFKHEDSTGSKGEMGPGSVQWMTAAGGIIHSEMPIMKEGKLHGFQLWVNMPAKLKMSKPSYQNIKPRDIPEVRDHEKKIKIIAGKFQNKTGPAKGFVDPIYLDIELKKGKNFIYAIPSSHNAFIYLVSGEIKIGSKSHERLKNSTLICLKNGIDLKISSTEKSQFLLIAGKPIGESIARGGPFVMNTKQEILQAVQDYHSGNFVQKND
jgi:redox-sensitive bicupin YhaK (pirin superfamily)